MFKNMKLATKMSLGFGVLVVIAGVLGYVGWMGLTSVTEKSDLLVQGNECQQLLDSCAKLRRDFTIQGFAKDDKTGKTAVDKWYESYDEFSKKINSLAANSGLNTANKELANGAFSKSKAYKEAFDSQVESQKMKDDAFAVWGKTGSNIMKSIDESITKIIDPAMAAANQAKDADLMAKWEKVNNCITRDVYANFLQLRINGIYLVKINTEAQWGKFNEQLSACLNGKKKFDEMGRGNSERV